MFRKKIIPAGVVIIIIILTLTVFRPTLVNVFKLREKNQKNKEMLAKLIDKAQKLEAIDEVEIKKRVELVEEVLPSQKPVLELLSSLEQLSVEEGVVFGGLELKPGKIDELSKSKTEREEFEISFNIEGNLSNISSFVNKLEKTPPLMKIERMDLKLSRGRENISETEEIGSLKAALGVRVFYQFLPKTIGAIDQPLAMLSSKEREILNKISSYRTIPKIQSNAVTGKENLFSLP